MHDQYALFMNLSGEYINQLNGTLEALDTTESRATLYNLNKKVINDFGCSPWLHHIGDMEDYDITTFQSAMQTAFKNSGSATSLNRDCLNNLQKYRVLKTINPSHAKIEP